MASFSIALSTGGAIHQIDSIFGMMNYWKLFGIITAATTSIGGIINLVPTINNIKAQKEIKGLTARIDRADELKKEALEELFETEYRENNNEVAYNIPWEVNDSKKVGETRDYLNLAYSYGTIEDKMKKADSNNKLTEYLNSLEYSDDQIEVLNSLYAERKQGVTPKVLTKNKNN